MLIGHRRGANRDTVDLGQGADELVIAAGTDHSGAVLTGGEGVDTMSFGMPSRALLSVDASSGTATSGGRLFSAWSAFDEYVLATPGPQDFTGTAAPDDVTLSGDGLLTATTGEGDDTISLDPFFGVASGLVDGGAGRDTIDYSTFFDVVGSMVSRTIVVNEATLSFASVERIVAHTDTAVQLTGGDDDDDLQANGCDVTLRGGAGNDQLRVGRDVPSGVFTTSVTFGPRPCKLPTSHVYGEAGDDAMASYDFEVTRRGPIRERRIDDLLDGGDGIDVAKAGLGTDTCVAETPIACEM
ncbi:MAG: hypothetical protein H0X12_02905 [Nocardioides sp.]|nr:hypothetical protein [Nocardioides sp.]